MPSSIDVLPGAGRSWVADLALVYVHQMAFEELLVRNSGMIRKLVGRWPDGCPAMADCDDLRQTALLSIWRAIDKFDPTRGVPLNNWVGWSVTKDLQKALKKYKQLRDNDSRFWDHQVCEEKTFSAAMHVRESIPVRSLGQDAGIDGMRLLCEVIGRLPPEQGRAIADLASAVGIGAGQNGVHRAKRKRKRKTELRAYQAAQQLVDVIHEEVDGLDAANENDHTAVEENPTRLKPTCKAGRSRADTGQRHQGVVAGGS